MSSLICEIVTYSLYLTLFVHTFFVVSRRDSRSLEVSMPPLDIVSKSGTELEEASDCLSSGLSDLTKLPVLTNDTQYQLYTFNFDVRTCDLQSLGLVTYLSFWKHSRCF